MIQKIEFSLLSWKKNLHLQKDRAYFLHHSYYYLYKDNNSNLWKCFNLKRGYQLSLCIAYQGFVQLFLDSKFTFTSLWHFFSGAKSMDPWILHFLIFLATLGKSCLSSKFEPSASEHAQQWVACWSAGSWVSLQQGSCCRPLHTSEPEILSPWQQRAFCFSDEQFQRMEKAHLELPYQLLPAPLPARVNKRQYLSFSRPGLNIPGDRMKASEVYKREECSGVYYWFKDGFGLVTLLFSC